MKLGVAALAVDSESNHPNKWKSQMSHARPKQKNMGAAHSTHSSWSRSFSSLQPNHFFSSVRSCTHTVRMQIHHSKFVGAVPFAVNTDIRPEWQADRDAPPFLQLCLWRLCTLARTSCPHAKTQSCQHAPTFRPSLLVLQPLFQLSLSLSFGFVSFLGNAFFVNTAILSQMSRLVALVGLPKFCTSRHEASSANELFSHESRLTRVREQHTLSRGHWRAATITQNSRTDSHYL